MDPVFGVMHILTIGLIKFNGRDLNTDVDGFVNIISFMSKNLY